MLTSSSRKTRDMRPDLQCKQSAVWRLYPAVVDAGKIDEMKSAGGLSRFTSLDSASSLVNWHGDLDPNIPRNFRPLVKGSIGIVVVLMNFIVSLAISVFSGIEDQVKEEFKVSLEAMKLPVSLYIFGLSMGPLFFGPASDYYGRKVPLVTGMTGFIFFTLLVTLVRDFESVVVFRFLAAACGSAAYVIPPGMYVDLYGPVGRAVGYQIFATGAFLGGSLGPPVAALMVESHDLSWRWSMWLVVFVATPLTLAMVLLPESLESILLQRMSKRLRLKTRDWSWHAPRDERPFQLRHYLSRPWRMLVREPVLIIVTLAFTLDYGIQSLTYTAIPRAFREPRDWGVAESASALMVTISGFMLGCSVVVADTLIRFAKKMRNGSRPPPESRLPPMIGGMATLACGLFVFAWTAREEVPAASQLLAEVLVGAGMYMGWAIGTVYLQDLYLEHANSALAVCAFVRYAIGSVFPLFADPLYHRLGIKWAISLLGFMCAALVPLHVIFYLFGDRMRRSPPAWE